MKNDEPLWTIDELSARVAAALEQGYDGPPNGRVRDVPDRRTIRYYTTLGLIDRPAEMRGRTAFYGGRHMLQLVAIKKLQASGRSLAEVQRALAGQPDQVLSQVAGLDGPGPAPGKESAPQPRPSRAGDFWRQAPVPHESRVSEETGRDGEGGLPLFRPKRGPAETYHGIPLVDGVTLLLASSRPLDGPDLQAIRAAAAPLIDTLARRQLIRNR